MRRRRARPPPPALHRGGRNTFRDSPPIVALPPCPVILGVPAAVIRDASAGDPVDCQLHGFLVSTRRPHIIVIERDSSAYGADVASDTSRRHSICAASELYFERFLLHSRFALRAEKRPALPEKFLVIVDFELIELLFAELVVGILNPMLFPEFLAVYVGDFVVSVLCDKPGDAFLEYAVCHGAAGYVGVRVHRSLLFGIFSALAKDRFAIHPFEIFAVEFRYEQLLVVPLPREPEHGRRGQGRRRGQGGRG